MIIKLFIILITLIASVGYIAFKIEKNPKHSIPKKDISICAVIIVAVFLLINSFTIVPAGYSGVKVVLGSVQEEPVDAGLRLKIPFVTKIVHIDNHIIRTDVEGTSSSKDLQVVSSTFSVNYHIIPSSSANIYKTVGKDVENVIIRPAIQEASKAISSKFSAEELITNRSVAGSQMKETLQEKVKEYGIQIDEFNIINFDFSSEFNAAIEAKQTAQQQALKAQQDLERIKVEAEQKVTEAQAEAEAYKLKSQEITDEMIRMTAVEKWDGKLPTIVSDGSELLDVSGLTK